MTVWLKFVSCFSKFCFQFNSNTLIIKSTRQAHTYIAKKNSAPLKFKKSTNRRPVAVGLYAVSTSKLITIPYLSRSSVQWQILNINS